jgi:hypothetical protein
LAGSSRSYELREYIPVFAIPIPKRHNPVIVVPTYRSLSVELKPDDDYGLRFEGLITPPIKSLVRTFFMLIEKEAGIPHGFVIKVSGAISHEGFLYVAITNKILEYLTGPLDEEIIKSAMAIDSEIGTDDSIKALRLSEILDNAYIWRASEGYVTCSNRLIVDAEVVRSFEMKYESPEFIEVITHLAGLTVIELFRAIEEGLITDKIITLIRTYNSLWHILYGVPVPEINQGLIVSIKDISGVTWYELRFKYQKKEN